MRKMLGHAPRRRRAVAPCKRLDDLAMLVGAAVGAIAAVAQERRAADEVLDEAVERGVAGGFCKPLVELDGKALALLEIAPLVGALFLAHEAAQRRNFLRTERAREALHQRRLEQAACFEQVARF